MKRSVVLCVGIFALVLVPGIASAQGWLAPGLPALPSFGGNGCGSCYGGLGGLMIGADVAYVGYSRATKLEFVSSTVEPAIFNWRHGYPVQGIQLSADVVAAPNDRIAFIGRGTWLLPWNGQSFENFNSNGLFGTAERKWSTNLQWWTLEGAGAIAMNGLSAVLVGLRYDSFQTRFKNPSGATFTSLPNEEADLQVNFWIPYAGVVVHQGFAKFGIIAAPWVPGNLKYGQTLNGATGVLLSPRVDGSGTLRSCYFFETWGEFTTNVLGFGTALFVKYTLIHARVEDSLSSFFSNAAVEVGSRQLEITFDRPNWIVGAEATLNFNSPL